MTGSLRRRLAPLQRYSNTFGFAATPYARPVQSQKVEAEQSQPDTAIQNINTRRCANITANSGWNRYGGLEFMVHKGALVILGAEYQHIDLRSKDGLHRHHLCRFCRFVGAPFSFDHGAVVDIVRARLTIKTPGYGWWGPT